MKNFRDWFVVLALGLFWMTHWTLPLLGADPEETAAAVSTPIPNATATSTSNLGGPTASQPTGSKVAIIPIQGMIYSFTFDSLKRRVDRAIQEGADLIVIELNTPGGEVHTALKISKYIKQLPKPTVAWVNNEAYSAGIMIASACDEIVMSKSSATGDCAPILMGKEMAPTERAKALSPILEEFRDSASDNQYDYALFHAMCVLGVEVYQIEHKTTGQMKLVNQADYQIMVNGLSREEALKVVAPGSLQGKQSSALTVGKVAVEVAKPQDQNQWKLVKQIHDGSTLLTLNQKRATFVGLNKKIVSNQAELASWLNTPAGNVRVVSQSWSEGLVNWVTHPIVKGILVMLILVGGYMELQAPGLGLPGALAGTAILILFGVPFLVGLSDIWHIITFFIGFILLMVEFFVIPGFGIAGICGVIMMIVGLAAAGLPYGGGGGGSGGVYIPNVKMMAYIRNALVAVFVGMVFGVGIMFMLMRHAQSLPWLHRMILQTTHKPNTALAGAGESGANSDTGGVAPLSGSQVLGIGLIHVGDIGIVTSQLRPAGIAQFQNQPIDVCSSQKWVAAGQQIRITAIQGSHITVEPTDA